MKTIAADFTNVARGGKVRVWADDVRAVNDRERVALVESAEDLLREAVLVERDGDWAYFEVSPRPLLESLDQPGFYLRPRQSVVATPIRPTQDLLV